VEIVAIVFALGMSLFSCIAYVLGLRQDRDYHERRAARYIDLYHALLAEAVRLRRGEFTEEEFQNLCHNFTADDRERFRRGLRGVPAQTVRLSQGGQPVTREEILSMPAGPALDAAVAEAVGWRWEPSKTSRYHWWRGAEGRPEPPAYSRDAGLALEAVGATTPGDPGWFRLEFSRGGWEATFYPPHVLAIHARADTPAVACCRAVLLPGLWREGKEGRCASETS
jgi:hypothetical protein